MGKLHGKAKAAFLARMNKGRKKAGLKSIKGSSNPRKRRRRKNPATLSAHGREPMYRTVRKKFGKYMTPAEIAEMQRGADVTSREYVSESAALRATPMDQLWIAKELGQLKPRIAELKKLQKLSNSQKNELARLKARLEKAEAFKHKAKAEGLTVEEKFVSNPKKKKKGKKAKARKHSKKAKSHKRRKAKKAAPKRSRRRRKHKREASAHVFKQAKTFKFKKAKRKVRVKMVGIVNPISVDAAKPLLWAAGGYVVALGLYKVADHYSGGKISGAIASAMPASIAPIATPFLLPAIGIGMGVALNKALDSSLGDKIPARAQVRALAHGAVMVGGVLAALAAVNAVVGLVKQNAPQIANLPVIGPMLSGVTYYPGGHGQDFGAYPQMGNADFGLIPSGLRGIPAGMQGVEFFPKRAAMGEVQFYPDGANGDDMFRESEAGQAMEAEGLGIVPAGLSGADFGDMEGLGEGQMG